MTLSAWSFTQGIYNGLLEKAALFNAPLKVIMGDFNYKEVDWKNNLVNCGPNHPATATYDKINDLFLSQLVQEPTRFRSGETQNTLDWVVTNNPDKVDHLCYGSPLGKKGDHCTITFNIKACYIRNIDGGLPQFSKTRFDDFKIFLNNINWEFILCNLNIEQAWTTFQNKMSEAIHQFVPLSKPRLHKSPPWSNNLTRQAVKDKNKAWSTYKKNKNEENWANFAAARNKCNRQITNQKIDFEKRMSTNIKSNPKIFWNYVKYTTGGQKDVPTLKNSQGTSVTCNLEKAELFNNYFSEVYTKEDLVNVPEPAIIHNIPPLEKCVLTLATVKKQLEKLNISKAAGPDQIHPKLIFELRENLALPLYIIYQKSLREGKLPSQWKSAYIKPIYKKGAKHMASNYRPVSLTSVCCKMLERIIREDIMKHLDKNELLSRDQHGFRSGRSCCTQLLELMEIWTNMLDKGVGWDCIYLDFAKAFDKVPHARLSKKLKALGIKGDLCLWLEDFLNDRQQTVVIKNCKSEPKEVISGIPQGSVLGPILFIIYINDLPEVVKSNVKIFADDTKLFNAITNQSLDNTSNLQSDLKALEDWSQKWQLKFNAEKCKVIHYGSNNPKTGYTLNGTSLECSLAEKDLGIIFDNKLNFSEHVGKVTAKANSRLAIIKRTISNLTPEIFLPLYKALVRPLLEYCSPVWNPMLKKDKTEIEKVQRRATKLIKSLSDLEYDERLYRLGLDSLNFRRRRADLIQVFRIIKKIDDLDIQLFFEFLKSDRTRGHNLRIFKTHCSGNTRANSFSNRIINDWNSLSQEVVDCKTINSFKSALKKFWINHPERFDMP